MYKSQVFVIRAILGAGFGLLLSRIFYPGASLVFVIGLCVALVALAYLTEYLRHRSSRRAEPKPRRQ